MFDIGWVEMAVIAILLIIVVGPKDLPKILHTVGQWVNQARALARSFQENLDEMVRESGLDDVRKEIESVTDYDIGGEITKAIDSDGKIAGALDFGEEDDEDKDKDKDKDKDEDKDEDKDKDDDEDESENPSPGEAQDDAAGEPVESANKDKEPDR